MLEHRDDPDGERLTGIKHWLSRLAFSFIILGGVAAYEGWKAHGRGQDERATVLLIGAASGVGLGLAGLRLRHRPR